MSTIYITIFAFMILLGYEIRYRLLNEDLIKLRTKANILDEEISRLKAQMELKKNIYDDIKPPA